MALVKQPVEVNFSKGLDTKSDPFQLPIGNFSRLQNSVFDKAGRMTKRNGFGALTALPSATKTLTTFNGNLTAIGDTLQAYSPGTTLWTNKGFVAPATIDVLPVVRSNTSQSVQDSAISATGLVCVVYQDTGTGSTQYMYSVSDATTGQNILPNAVIPSSGTVDTPARVFYLGTKFIIIFSSQVSAVERLRYVAIDTVNPVAPVADVDIGANLRSSAGFMPFDGVVASGKLYISWSDSTANTVCIRTLNTSLVLSSTVTFASQAGIVFSVVADTSGGSPVIWVTYFFDTGGLTKALAVDSSLVTVLSPTTLLSSITVRSITGVATGNVQTIFYELPDQYSYDGAVPTNYVRKLTVNTAGTIGSPATVSLSVGLASKAFVVNSQTYFTTVYFSTNQASYFLMDSSGHVISRFAYGNAGGYKAGKLPSAYVSGSSAVVSYQFADLIIPVNKSQGLTFQNSVISQFGINLASFTFGSKPITSEIGALNFTGGFLWQFDGMSAVENNFFLWPDNVETTIATTGGFITHQTYFYVALYEWCDNQGNIHRSAPSIPIQTIVTNSGDVNKVTINVPTLRLTYKTTNSVKISIFRWSTAQQTYYEVTSVTSPLINNPAINSVSFEDTQADSSIIGNAILYTTGGVVENIGAPSFKATTLFDSRLWGIDSEDTNLLWYSKQVIENTPVEMSDLFTVFVSPSISAQGSTGPNKCLAPMDDKLIIFKKDALYYINGSGPDNTGSNSQYSQPTFISATVGCANPNSIVFIPQGLMFQSDKGIWLLNRALETSYIGFPVETFTQTALVESAVSVPGTNQIRFTMDSGVTLLYDYFFNQWGTFTGIPALSSTLYNNLHTYVDSSGAVFQETVGSYLDNGTPVVQAFTTGWIKASGLLGFQRLYWLNILGTYSSPHTLTFQIAYDYDSTVAQSVVVTPDSTLSVEQERVFFERGKCTAFQLLFDEAYDASIGPAAGAGLTMSGLNLTIGVKKAYPTPSAARSFG